MKINCKLKGLPVDVFQMILPMLDVKSLGHLDTAISDHTLRIHFLDCIRTSSMKLDPDDNYVYSKDYNTFKHWCDMRSISLVITRFLPDVEYVAIALSLKWTDDWYCYWDESLPMPDNVYVFKPRLAMTRNKIITSSEAPRDFLSALLTINSFENTMASSLHELSSRLGNFSSESEYEMWPFMLPVLADMPTLNGASFLSLLGAHMSITSSIIHEGEDLSASLWELGTVDRSNLFSLLPDYFWFSSGVDHMNPCPIFLLSRVTPTLVAGFSTAGVYT
jgi:hypothetical protein